MGLRTWLYQHTGIRLKHIDDPLIKQIQELKKEIKALKNQKEKEPSAFDFQEYCKKNNIKLGKNVYIRPSTHLSKNSTIGDQTYIWDDCGMREHTIIGNYCAIATGVVLGAVPHPSTWLSTHPFQYNFPAIGAVATNKHKEFIYEKPLHCTIGNDVWIGLRAIISPGINIGDGAIIASGAIVTKDVPPYAIVGGVPAKIIKYRFDEPTIKELLKLKWWELDADLLIAHNIDFDNVPKAIEQIKQIKSQHR